MARPIRVKLILIAALTTLAGGCGNKTVVNGQITLDGKPLAGAQVRLVATEVSKQRAHVGGTDASGHFAFQSDSSSGDIEPGSYVVLILKYGVRDEAAPKPGAMMGAPNIVPDIYNDRAKTPNKIEIHEGTNDLEPIELVSKPASEPEA